MKKSSRILLGRIAGAHSIRGEVLVHAYTAEPEAIATYGPLSDATGARSFQIESARATAKGVVARLKGVSDRNAAEALRGVELYIDRDKLPPATEDEFYHADLIGLAAVGPDGQTIGEIVAVQNFGAGDLLEIRRAGSASTEFILFNEAAVPSVDVSAGRVVAVLPPVTEDEEE